MQKSPSFVEIAVWEAVTRRTRVDLVLRSVTGRTDTRLISRFLGLPPDGLIALDVPRTTRGDRAFVPAGWEVGMAFDIAGVWLQARTTVAGHCQFPLRPTRRVDALLVRRPERILSANRRRRPRRRVDPSRPIRATVWPAGMGGPAPPEEAHAGWLIDSSDGGLGVGLAKPLRLEVGSPCYLRLAEPGAAECPLFRGRLRHCTPQDDGTWRAGFGEVSELGPGEAIGLLMSAAAPRADGG